MGNRNRTAGHNWERSVAKILATFFPKILTSRYASRATDDLKIDFINTEDYNFQAKTYSKRLAYDHMLNEMPEGELNIIIEKKTQKSRKRFMEQGRYVHMELSTFLELLKRTKR